MKTQKSRGVTAISCREKSHFTVRGRKKKGGMIQGKLRVRSMPGAFLVLGVIVVVVGTALAMMGYWPYRISKTSILGVSDGDSIPESQTSGLGLGAKGLLSTASLIHSERMKLLGPVIMGVGLFILICANTVLNENRDRETQMLLAQMRSVICSVSTTVPSADLKEIAGTNSMAQPYQCVSTLPDAHLNILCLEQLASSEALLQTNRLRGLENCGQGIYELAALQMEAPHHPDSDPSLSHRSFHSNSYKSSQSDLNGQFGAEHRGKASFRSQATSVVNLNSNLVSTSSVSTLGLDEVDLPTAQPRRCQSVGYRTNHYRAQSSLCVKEGFHRAQEEYAINQLVMTMRDGGSQVCVNIPGQVLDAAEEQAHHSWTQLDLGSVKLRNKEDSVDKLLDQLEHQCSQWDKSFGSGSF
uniref:Uncharacterized protein n=1 Tax=Mola mola TaxID=94237 RepID=A0A3Q3X1V0_MOLML